MQRFLDPRNDFAFKHIFGSEDHKDITIDFLNSILHLENERQIKNIEFLNATQAPLYAGRKISMVDISCQDQRGIKYIVEMQMARTAGFLDRIQYYSAKTYVGQLSSSQDYPKLNQVILLAILDHVQFPQNPDYQSVHTMRDVKTNECILNAFLFKFIELPKFTKTHEELFSVEDKWLYFLKHAWAENTIFDNFEGTVVEKAYHALERYNFNPKQIVAYEDAGLALVDFENTSKVRYEEGLAEGREEGREEGLVQGIEKKQHEIILKMLQQGSCDDFIIDITSISQEELDRIKKS
jgi:predicted transposase/invertase (TIGR01784 family)